VSDNVERRFETDIHTYIQLFIPDLLLRTLRAPKIKTCETTDELGWFYP